MIIGIDIRDLRLARTGQKTTLEELCRQFRLLEDNTHTFYFFDTSIPVYTGRNKFMLMTEHIRQQLWKQLVLPLKAWSRKCDIVYCNDYFAPYIRLGYKTVQIFHDAFFYEYPQYCNSIWLLLFKHIAVPAARRSAFIITPTQYAKQRVQHFTQISSEKIIVVHQGPKTMTTGTITQAIPEWLPTTQGFRYILHVGVMEKRKNLPRLILAFKKLKQLGYAQYKLVLAGKGNGKKHSDDTAHIIKTIQENDLEKDVVMPGYLPDDMLGVVYSGADLYVFPSINEGFGIPILEAFRFETPVMVADNTCLPEVGGDAVLTFDPFDEDDMMNKMKMVLDDDNLKAELRRKGNARLTNFTWQKTAAETIAVFEKCTGTTI